MAAKCPICKKTKMRFGGMGAYDGTYCGKCFDRAIEKGMRSEDIGKLKVHEIAEYLEKVPSHETKKYVSEIREKRKQEKNNIKENMPYLDKFRETYADYFNTSMMVENASIQNTATQIFWHVSQLRKRRLLERGITVSEKAKHKKMSQQMEEYFEEEIFDGKYEIISIKETIDAARTYSKKDKVIWQNDRYNMAGYVLHNVHQVGEHKVVCPSCGNVSDRSNLIDSCDYCGTKFSVEDLGLRVAEYQESENLETKNGNRFFGSKDEKKGSIITGLILLFLSYIFGFMDDFSGVLRCLVVTAIISWPVYVLGFKLMVYMIFNHKANYQNTELYEIEELRRSEKEVAMIREHDPLFSVEACYAEVENIVMAHYYADQRAQVSGFWAEEDPAQIDQILAANKNVIHADMIAIGITDYRVDDRYQYLTTTMTLKVLRENKPDEITETQETKSITWVKAAECKSQAVCGPKAFICKSCGAPLSLMEGGRCQYCSNRIDLTKYGWALAEINQK